MEGFSVAIKESSKELTSKQKVMFKDTTDCVKLDTATMEGPVTIEVDSYVVLDVHNEKSDNKDYEVYVVVAKDGTRYSTGSESFFSAFKNIIDEMKDSSEEWALKVFRLPSKNRLGKDFLTCSII